MKKLILFTALVACVCIVSSFINYRATNKAGVLNNSFIATKHTSPLQVNVQPFCKMTFIDHRGYSLKLSTNTVHVSSRNLTFIFDTGEKLIISFSILRPGHFVAESARSKDPNILFFPARSNGQPVPMVGAVIITSVKPEVTGNFSHIISDDDEHITLVAGSFRL
jgi:hypothetical protein